METPGYTRETQRGLNVPFEDVLDALRDYGYPIRSNEPYASITDDCGSQGALVEPGTVLCLVWTDEEALDD